MAINTTNSVSGAPITATTAKISTNKPETSSPPRSNNEDKVVLTSKATQLSKLADTVAHQSGFDTHRVHQLQIELGDDRYNANFQHVAQKFIGFEQALNQARV